MPNRQYPYLTKKSWMKMKRENTYRINGQLYAHGWPINETAIDKELGCSGDAHSPTEPSLVDKLHVHGNHGIPKYNPRHKSRTTPANDQDPRPGPHSLHPSPDSLLYRAPRRDQPDRLSSPPHVAEGPPHVVHESPSGMGWGIPSSLYGNPGSPVFSDGSAGYNPTSPFHGPVSPAFRRATGGDNLGSPVYSPASPAFHPASGGDSLGSPAHSPASPAFRPASGGDSPGNPVYSPTSPIYKRTSPATFMDWSTSPQHFDGPLNHIPGNSRPSMNEPSPLVPKLKPALLADAILPPRLAEENMLSPLHGSAPFKNASPGPMTPRTAQKPEGFATDRLCSFARKPPTLKKLDISRLAVTSRVSEDVAGMASLSIDKETPAPNDPKYNALTDDINNSGDHSQNRENPMEILGEGLANLGDWEEDLLDGGSYEYILRA